MSIPERPVYASQPRPLREQVAKLLQNASDEKAEGVVHAVVVPDSNLLRNADIAADVFSRLKGQRFETVILVAPSHEGEFERLTICSVDTYRTPLGDVPVNDRLRHELCDEDDDIFIDDSGHYHTEGVDVQLPFLQELMDDFNIVPVVMGEESPALCRELGHAIGEVMYNRRTLVVASTDLLRADGGVMEDLKREIESGEVSRLMSLVNGDRMELEGKGALLVALIASLRRRGNYQQVLAMRPPENGLPGAVGAIFGRR